MTTMLMPALVTFLLLLLTTLAYFLWRKYSSRADTILLVGLNGSGKTVVFSKLINSKNVWHTYTSQKENLFTDYFSKTGAHYKLVDYPGAESLRNSLFLNWLSKDRNTLRCIIFLVDSATFNQRAKDVAEFLYGVFFESQKAIPVLVACNKQDLGHAKSSKAIREILEREFGLINVSREAALSSTSGDSPQKRLLTNTGAAFQWSDLTNKSTRVDFAECSAEEDENFSLDAVREWIDRA